MISKLHHILAFVAVAALGSGCAIDTSTGGDEVSQGQADLKKAESYGVETVHVPGATGDGITVAPQPVDLVQIVKTDNLLGTPGTDEGPRPHPWQPAPDESNTNTGTSSNTGTDTSGKSAK